MLLALGILVGVFGTSFTAIASSAFPRRECFATPFASFGNFDWTAHFTLVTIQR